MANPRTSLSNAIEFMFEMNELSKIVYMETRSTALILSTASDVWISQELAVFCLVGRKETYREPEEGVSSLPMPLGAPLYLS
jgi:hypothetical protein